MGFQVLIDSVIDGSSGDRVEFSCGLNDASDEDAAVKRAFELAGEARAPGGDYHITVWPKDEQGAPSGPVVKFSCTVSWGKIVKHHAPDRAALVAAGLAVPGACLREAAPAAKAGEG